jgi:hypothetical protein
MEAFCTRVCVSWLERVSIIDASMTRDKTLNCIAMVMDQEWVEEDLWSKVTGKEC